jgi:hypothetical protein
MCALAPVVILVSVIAVTFVILGSFTIFAIFDDDR